MKIRTGFVSNSSSASFIITIQETKERFLSQILDEWNFDFFNRDSFKLIIENQVLWYASEITKITSNDSIETPIETIINPAIIPTYEDKITALNDLHKKIATMTDNEFAEAVLKYNDDITIEEAPSFIKIRSWTAMYNAIDDMGPVMMMLVCFCSLNRIPFTIDAVSDY